ncbi:MAG UNVERIFIED_CONTAM: hypothetical protein LVR18_25690 [Planctomycetaceae bacterium]|jgi:hypothetical protein
MGGAEMAGSRHHKRVLTGDASKVVSSASRRRFLQATSLLPAMSLTPTLFTDEVRPQPIPVAALITAYYPVSHADVIVSKILEGYQRTNAAPRSGLRLVSMYVEQSHPHDISRELADRHQVRLCKSIDEAITFGTDRLQVAGVLSVAEHGDYPLTPVTLQKMYPRRRFFDGMVAAFRRCGAVTPCFNDKHLGWRWEDAKAMVDTARQMNFPLLAGSSLPLTWRFPQLELPLDCDVESALTIGYGPLEDYGFHGARSPSVPGRTSPRRRSRCAVD